METHYQTPHSFNLGDVAGNGLVDRRLFLTGSAAAGAAASGIASPEPASADALSVGSWMKVPGSPFVGYGQPSRFEDKVVRVAANAPNAPGTGAARTPLHRLNGTITPNGLHFERSHSGIPDIDPDAHRLLIHGSSSGRWFSRWICCRAIRWNLGSHSSNAGAMVYNSIRRTLPRLIARPCTVSCRARNGPA
jgi:hypothetical protein